VRGKEPYRASFEISNTVSRLESCEIKRYLVATILEKDR
jgi:hypothetical protein